MEITGESLFLILFWIMFTGVIWMPTTWLLLSIFTPKKLLDRYFKEPHFTLAETVLMAQFPGFLIRTGIFAWLSLIPALDRKRGIKNIETYIPRWYSISLKVFMIGVVLTMFLIFSLMGILFFMEPDQA